MPGRQPATTGPITLLLTLLALLPAAGSLGQEDQAVLAAESFAFDGGVLVLDKRLLEHKGQALAVIEEEVREAKRAQAINHVAVRRTAQLITDTVFELGGFPKDGELYADSLQSSTELLTRCQKPAYLLPDSVTVYVLQQDTAKDYLRIGGKLPFTWYNRTTDKVNFQGGAYFAQHDVLLPALLVVEGINDPDQAGFTPKWLRTNLRQVYLHVKDELVSALLTGQDDLPPPDPGLPVAAFGMVEATMQLWHNLLKSETALHHDDHTAWFTNGMSLVLGELTLNRMKAERAAWLLYQLKTGGGDPALGLPKEPDPKAYLRFTNRHPITLKTSESSKELADYRYAAAVLEALLLVEHLTEPRLPELFRLIGSDGIDTTAKLEAAIKGTFGYDVGARLDLYQPEGTAQELYERAIARAFEHRDAGESSGFLWQLIRAHDIQIGRAMEDVPGLYRMLYQTVRQFRNEQAASAIVLDVWWTVLARQTNPPNDDDLRQLAFRWVSIAMVQKSPGLASGLIKKLDDTPLRFEGIIPNGAAIEQFIKLIRASRLINEGEIDAAQALIDEALRDYPEDDPDGLREQILLPNIDLLETRIQTKRPVAPVLGMLGRQ